MPSIASLALLSPSLDYRGLRIEAAVRKVSRPVLLVAGDDDPYASRSARELQKAGGGPRELLILKQAGHGTAMFGRDPDAGRCAGGLVSPNVVMIFVPCPRNPSSSALPACFSASSSAGSSAASRRVRPRSSDHRARRRGASRRRPPPPFDESRASDARGDDAKNRSDAESRVQLGNLYFDAERFADATKWYEEALKIDPKDVNASTDLGIAYYYMNQPDRALAQFERSLAIDPKHTKTLLNIGIVRAFGKQDLEGAAKAWQQVLDVAPVVAGSGVARSRRWRACGRRTRRAARRRRRRASPASELTPCSG